MKITCSKTNPPLGGLLVANYVVKHSGTALEVVWGDETVVSNTQCKTSNDLARAITKGISNGVVGSNAIELTQIDHWLTFALGNLRSKSDFPKAIVVLDEALGPVTYLVGKRLTTADLIVFGTLYSSRQWHDLVAKKAASVNVLRWYNFVSSQDIVKSTINGLPEDIKAALQPQERANRQQSVEKSSTGARAREGKFIELPGAEMGKVVVRFPPEASGYLHIGHAKAALLNQYYQEAFKGKLVMRFDDTNPAKENPHFEKVILEDVKMLELKPDMFTHTSQYFDLMLEYCEKLIRDGKAYVDDTEAELMKQQREQRIESVNRNVSVDSNLQRWEEMKKGTEQGQKYCVRAKIDMQSANGCMRDPTIYRCKNEPHPRTGEQYKVYPTYDFACPIVDSVEGVTHTLRTMEYHDRDPQYYWFIEALGLRKPYIWEYSRLSMTNTVLSKRKLTWFVQEGLVDGWDDPRMPTVRGVLRRGMTVEGLKEFIIAQGSSRSVVFMEWDKIWAFNKKVIDPIVPRFTALESTDSVLINVQNAKEECLIVAKHPKNADVGTKEVWVGPKILIDRVDADVLKEGENTTFINWGNILIKKINKDSNGSITSIDAVTNLDNKDYKKTLKLTWLADTDKARFTPTYCVYFDHLMSKALLGKDEDFKEFVNRDTRKEVEMLGDPELRKVQAGDIIQLQRRGFFRVDVAYGEASTFSGREQAVILFYVPDGHTKENPAISTSSGNVKKQVDKTTTNGPTKSAASINEDIVKQGDLVRNLKQQKAPKLDIDNAVKLLLALKLEYKTVTNTEWKPGCVPSTTQDISLDELNTKIVTQGDKVRQLKSAKAPKALIDPELKTHISCTDWKQPVVSNKPDAITISLKITKQGDKVRELKTKKADKASIDVEIKTLLSLKNEYKSVTGQDWKPGAAATPLKSSVAASENEILQKIVDQGDKVRQLKSAKADKVVVDAEVKALLSLKADFKTVTGKDWKPDMKPLITDTATSLPLPVNEEGSGPTKSALTAKITEQGDVVRNLKTQKASKEEVDVAVKVLLELKAEYKKIVGEDFPTATRAPAKPKESKPAAQSTKVVKQKPAQKEKKPVEAAGDSGLKKQTRLGLEAKKEENLSDWYSQIITKSEMIEYYDVSGCYIFRPWSYAVWEAIKEWFDAEIKQLDVQNCYFPIFVSKNALEREKKHIADFAPEVAWVTKSGDSDMAEPIAVRPTSETVMYPAYAKWIQSYRDLPIKLNQWNNVVRWEFKHPQPFLRTREFLWQEGHTAHASQADAMAEVQLILDHYATIYQDLLAIPVIKGKKTDKEVFAGAAYTMTVEAFVSASGRAIQGATSHHLGQNFSKMFDIVYEDPETQEKKFVYQNSWGITTRTIGVMIMVHADNQGLVLPPRVACIQVVIVPCGVTVDLAEDRRKSLQESCDTLEGDLKNAGVKTKGDYRSNYSPGWKFNHWELKGVPIRIELGPKDIEKNQIVAVRRDTGEKLVIPRGNAVEKLKQLLNDIHNNLYSKALNDLESHKVLLTDWAEFPTNLDKKNIILAPFCGEISCEDKIKADSAREDTESAEPGAPAMGAKSLCIPTIQPAPIKPTDKCIHPDCTRKPQFYTLFGRSY